MTETELNGKQETVPVETPAAEVVETPVVKVPAETVKSEDERVVPQSKVNEIVGAAKKDAYQKAYERALQDVHAQGISDATPTTSSQNDNTDSSAVDEGRIRELIQQEADKKVIEKTWTDMVNGVVQKFDGGKEKYNDFDDTVRILNFEKNAHLIGYLHELDNAADVAYELAKNPAKFTTLNDLARDNPEWAAREFNNLAKSIKDNQATLQQQSAPEPLDQLKPSNTGTDNGSHTVSDLRRDPKLRG